AKRVITEAQLRHALQIQPQSARRVGRVLVELGGLVEDRLTAVLGEHLDVPVVNLGRQEVDAEAARLVPEEFARRHVVLPISRENGDLGVAMADPANLHLINDLRLITGLGIVAHIAGRSDILAKLSRIPSTGPRSHAAAAALDDARPPLAN